MKIMKYENYFPDTTRAQLKDLKPQTVLGLWFEYHGERKTPAVIYFGSDLREWHDDPNCYNGRAWVHYDNALHPVFLPNGERFERRDLANVSAYYRNGVICDYNKDW